MEELTRSYERLKSLVETIPVSISAPALLIVWILVLRLLKGFVILHLELWTRKTASRWADAVVDAVSFPMNVLILSSGLVVVESFLTLPEAADRIAVIVLQASVVLAVVLFADRVLKAVLDQNAGRIASLGLSHGMVKGATRGLVIGLGALVFLQEIGISITPLLASLGVSSLAVALALQDTLSNFFAGIYVAADKPVRVGDFVKLESGDEGYVEEIGWRSTRIRTLPNNTVVVPNSKLTGGIVMNYYLPTKDLAVLVQVGVHYDSDLRRVETVTCEAAKDVMRSVQGGVPDFEPFIRYHTFGDSSVNFTVILRGKEFVDQYLIKHEFIKRLHERYKEEGITIPFPIRTLEVSRQTAEHLAGALSERSGNLRTSS